MAPPLPKLVVLPLLFLPILLLHRVSAHLDRLDDSSATATAFIDPLLYEVQDSLASISYDDNDDNDNDSQDSSVDHHGNRRWLFWQRAHYYISYAAMSANHVPCRPLSGSSYYNHHCNRLSGSVHPYFRSCSAITRCRR